MRLNDVSRFALRLAAVVVALLFGFDVANADGTSNTTPLFQNFTLHLANAQTGAPVHGARVTFFRADTGEVAAHYASDDNGQAEVRLDPGTYRFTVIKTGYQVARGVATMIPIPTTRSAVCLHCDAAIVLMNPGIADMTEDVSLCTDLSDPLQTATTYVVCNGSPF